MRLRLLPILFGVASCAPSVEFQGVARSPLPLASAIAAYEAAPAKPHIITGWIITDGMFAMDEHLHLMRVEAARRGCDAIQWNPNHRLVDGVISDDQTGVWLYGAHPIGARAACLAWRSD